MIRPGSGRQLIFIFVAVAVASIATGLALIDPPWVQRAKSMDDRRTYDLEMLESELRYYRDETGALPDSLEELGEGLLDFRTDPESGIPYDYRVLGADSYEICAEFAYENPGTAGMFARHDAGRHCFERTLKPADLYE
jgi:hypothetical protein